MTTPTMRPSPTNNNYSGSSLSHHHRKKARSIRVSVWWWLAGCALFGAGFFVGRVHENHHQHQQQHESFPLLSNSLLLTTTEKNTTKPSSVEAAVWSSAAEWPIMEEEGWTTIHVYYGSSKLLEEQLLPPLSSSLSAGPPPSSPSSSSQAPAVWFSQAGQDRIIAALFRGKRHGYFVDLAANDATLLSNTYALERYYRWTGLCIEPNPIYWKNLTYRSCQTVGAVVGGAPGTSQRMHFRFEALTHGGIADVGFNNGKRWQKQSVPQYTVSLYDVLQRMQAPTVIDYLSLDVEGAESFIMLNFPLGLEPPNYYIKVLTGERLQGPIRPYLKQHGYICLQKLAPWGETLWVHEKALPELDLTILNQTATWS